MGAECGACAGPHQARRVVRYKFARDGRVTCCGTRGIVSVAGDVVRTRGCGQGSNGNYVVCIYVRVCVRARVRVCVCVCVDVCAAAEAACTMFAGCVLVWRRSVGGGHTLTPTQTHSHKHTHTNKRTHTDTHKHTRTHTPRSICMAPVHAAFAVESSNAMPHCCHSRLGSAKAITRLTATAPKLDAGNTASGGGATATSVATKCEGTMIRVYSVAHGSQRFATW